MRRPLLIVGVAALVLGAVVYALASRSPSVGPASGDAPVRCDLRRTACRQGTLVVREPVVRTRCTIHGRPGAWVVAADPRGVIYACLERGAGG